MNPSRAAWFLLSLHVPIMALGTVMVVFDESGPRPIALAVVCGALLSALHLRHVFAASRGVRPRAWPVTLAAQALVAEVPVIWLSEAWSAPILTVGAAAMCLLPAGRPRWTAFAAAYGIGLVNQGVAVRNMITSGVVLGYAYVAIIIPVFVLALYGTVQLVRLLHELHDTRAELARSAVERERVRVSRDLHDLLGQSLSAISLKGDLAVRLLPIDAAAADAEIAGVAQAARVALHDMYAITRGEHAVALDEEITAASALLAAAGVDTKVIGTAPSHPVLAWAVREGTTNLLRHSNANHCTITLSPGALEMTNDGIRPHTSGDGSGIAGLRARALYAGGTASAAVHGTEFVLRVTVPTAEGAT